MRWIAYSLWFFSYILCIVVLSDFVNIIWIYRRMKNYLLNCWRNLHNFFFLFVQRLSEISGCTQIKHYVGGNLCSSCWLFFFQQEWMPFHYSWRTFHLFDDVFKQMQLARSWDFYQQGEGCGTLLTSRCWKYVISQLEFLYFSILGHIGDFNTFINHTYLMD